MKRTLTMWLLCVAAAHVVLGLTLPLFAYTDSFSLYAAQLDATFWRESAVPAEAANFQRWIVALFGPTVAAWGVLMVFLVRVGARTGERWPWEALLWSLLAWAPADIGISLIHAFWPHVVLDLVVVAGVALPAWWLRMHARKVCL